MWQVCVGTGSCAENIPWPNHLAPRLALQLQIATRMVVMVMGVENVGESPAPAFQGGKVRRRIWCVDSRSSPSGWVVNQIPVVVAQARELLHLKIKS